jgi:TatD DNase family protein
MSATQPLPTLPGIIDSHAHIHSGVLADDLPEILPRAEAAGLVGIVTIGTTLVDSQKAVALAATLKGVYATAGVHPHDAVEHSDADLAEIRELAAGDGCVAVGEIGLDYHYDHSPRDVQQHVFREQMAIAAEQGRPVVVHTREAEADTEAILCAFPGVTGVMHCYSSSADLAEVALDLGYMISFSGIITFAKADVVRAIAAGVPLDRIMIETDCPYLAPVPFRGKPNEPAYVTLVAEKLAEIKGVTPQEIADATAANARKLFGISE